MNIFIPELPAEQPRCTLFSVKANDLPVPVQTAYVSAMPFNRRWPGHQRDVSQREEAAFVLFSADGPLPMQVWADRPYQTAIVRPLARGVVPQRQADGSLAFTLPGPGQYTLELDGLHQALHIFCDPMTAYPVEPTAENTLYFGPGVHEPGLIRLQSHQTLYLAAGAVVYGSVRADGAQDIRILGQGILDNSHNVETILYPYEPPQEVDEAQDQAVDNALRTSAIHLENCDGVVIDGITVRDSLAYNIRPVSCRQVTIRWVKLIGNWRYNSDGIDMHNCEHVLIEHCFVRTFDDCICAKGYDAYHDTDKNPQRMVFRDLLVQHCVLWNDWNKALEIGAETYATEMCDIRWRDCDVIHATGAFMDILNVDQADIHDVTFEDIRCEYDDPAMRPLYQASESAVYTPQYEAGHQPLLFAAGIIYHHEYSTSKQQRGRIHRVQLCRIHINTFRPPQVRLEGFDADHLCEDILLDGIFYAGRRLQPAELAVQTNDLVQGLQIL